VKPVKVNRLSGAAAKIKIGQNGSYTQLSEVTPPTQQVYPTVFK